MIPELQQFDAELFLKINKGLSNDFFDQACRSALKSQLAQVNWAP